MCKNRKEFRETDPVHTHFCHTSIFGRSIPACYFFIIISLFFTLITVISFITPLEMLWKTTLFIQMVELRFIYQHTPHSYQHPVERVLFDLMFPAFCDVCTSSGGFLLQAVDEAVNISDFVQSGI